MTERPSGGDRILRDGAPTEAFPRVQPDQPTRPIAAEPVVGPVPVTGPFPAAEAEPAKASILDQLGGLSGVVASTVPVVAFVVVNSVTSLKPAVIVAVAVALGVAAWRVVRKEALQPAISGLFGVGIGAFIAYRTGEAKGYFLLGIWSSLVYCAVFVASVRPFRYAR